MKTKRIRAFVLAAAVTALMGSAAFAQVDRVDPSPAAEPGGAVTTPAQMPAPAMAQTPPTNATTTTAPRNDGIGWGWIGLLGLIGLTGLTRRDARPVDRDAAYPAKRTDSTATVGSGLR